MSIAARDRTRSRATVAALFAVALASSRSARATPPLVAAARCLSRGSAERALGARDGVVETLFVQASGSFTLATLPIDAVGAMTPADVRVSAGAIRFARLDRSAAWIGATTVRVQSGLTGRGVAVGVVDTGLDVAHADFRNADGTTRVAWLLDLSQPASGAYPDLEQQFGIVQGDGTLYGAVYATTDLDALLAAPGQAEMVPSDPVGHGTYVTSIAAGNGLATGNGEPASRFVGIAPEATLIAVRATSSDRLSDAAIVDGVAFVVNRAQAMGLPLVVNLSSGSHYGRHDGGSALEAALAALIPDGTPGQAIVVAAGNDGGQPIHARIDLESNDPGEIQIDVAQGEANDLAVVEIAYERSASIAASFPNGETTDWVDANVARGFGGSQGVVSIANATDDGAQAASPPMISPGSDVHTATVIFSGDAESGALRASGRYAILVRGSGPVHAWIADPGAATPPAAFAPGVVVSDGTIEVPATSPAVVSVGAIATRYDWTVVAPGAAPDAGPAFTADARAQLDVPDGDVASFSSRGPNRVNAPRPDLLAPGEWVIAARSAQALPNNPLSIFPSSEFIEADGVHGAGRGTSASAPHVSGAMALLLQAHPTATQSELLAALAATASASPDGGTRWNSAEGWGGIAVDRALLALDGMLGGGTADAAASALSVTAGEVADGEPIEITLAVRDAAGGFVAMPGAVSIVASAGTIGSLASVGDGLFTAEWRESGLAIGTNVTFTASAAGATLGGTANVVVVRSVTGYGEGLHATNGCSARPRRRANGTWAAMLVFVGVGCRRRRIRGLQATRAWPASPPSS